MPLTSILPITTTKKTIPLFLLMLTIGWALISCGPTPNQQPDGQQAPPSQQPDRLVLSLPREIWRASFPSLKDIVNVFTMNPDGTDLQPLIEGFDRYNFVVGLSPDRQQLLIASFLSIYDERQVGALYKVNIDGSNPTKLVDGFPFSGVPPTSPAALWLGHRNQIAYIGTEAGLTNLFVKNLDTNETRIIPQTLGIPPSYLVGYTENGRIYWKIGTLMDDGETFFTEKSLWLYNLETDYSDRAILPGQASYPRIDFSPAGDKAITQGWLVDTEVETEIKTIYFTGHEHSIAYWSPDGSQVMLVICETENCWDLNASYEIVVADSNFLQTTTIPLETNGVILGADWHPNQDKVLLSIYEKTDQGMELSPHILELETMTIKPMMENLAVVNPAYFPLWGLPGN